MVWIDHSMYRSRRLLVGKEMAGAMGEHSKVTYKIYAKLQKFQMEGKLSDKSVPALFALATQKREWSAGCVSSFSASTIS
jgi:hypothetical protein